MSASHYQERHSEKDKGKLYRETISAQQHTPEPKFVTPYKKRK